MKDLFALELDSHRIVDNQVSTKATIELDFFIDEGNCTLAIDPSAKLHKFICQACFICGFKQPGAEFPMNLNCRSYDVGG